MKKTCAIIGIFVFIFIVASGGFMPTDVNAKRICLFELPCDIEDIVCDMGGLCDGTCYPTIPYGKGGVFYCFGDWNNPHCSKDYYYPVPCEL